MLRPIASTAVMILFAVSTPSKACMPHMVYFQFGTARLNAEALSGLDYALDEFRRQPGARLRLIARTDGIGTADANKRLARRRGEAVRAALVRRGIPARAIEIDARGEAELAPGGSDSDDRVVIIDVIAPTAGCR